MNIAMKISSKPAGPWVRTLATLEACESRVARSEKDAMANRWEFGRELVKVRVKYKGRLVVPDELMKLAMQQCGLRQTEILNRIRFALKYETKKLMLDAVESYKSWRRITLEGLDQRKAKKTKKAAATDRPSRLPFLIRRVSKEAESWSRQHATLTRGQVKDIELLIAKLTTLLEQIDRNDGASKVKAS